MRELQHYAMWDEALALVAEVAEAHQLKLIPDARLFEPKIATYDRFGPEVAEKLARTRVLHLEGPFTKHPIRFDKIEGADPGGNYYVDVEVGPRLRWILPRVSKHDDRTLIPGTISMMKSYYDPTTDRSGPPSEELKDAFKRIVTTLKARLVHVSVGGEKVWVGRETKRLVDEGKLILER